MTSQSNFRLMIYCRKLNSVNNKTEVSVLFFNKFKGVSNIKNEMEIWLDWIIIENHTNNPLNVIKGKQDPFFKAVITHQIQ